MSDIEFGYGEVRKFNPQYEGIDWEQAWINKHEKTQVPIWGELEDELGEFCEQLHQDNCAFYINDTNSDFDCLVVRDHRDNGDFWISRLQTGSETFDSIFDKLNGEVMVIFTKYPFEQVAEFVMKLLVEN